MVAMHWSAVQTPLAQLVVLTYVAGNFTSKLCLIAAAISCSVFFSCMAVMAHWIAYS